MTQGATLSELAQRCGAPKTSLVGLLAGLKAENCVIRDDAGRYLLGPRFVSLAMRAISGRELTSLIRPFLEQLAEESGETAVLGALVPEADMAIYLDKVESTNPIRYAVAVGEQRDLYCTTVGKALLAYFEPDRLDRYLKSTPRKRFTPTTITRAGDLRAELTNIRSTGIARSDQERHPGASGLAAPIFAGDGRVAAVLLIAGPSSRIDANAGKHEQLLRRVASECTRLLGGINAVHGGNDTRPAAQERPRSG